MMSVMYARKRTDCFEVIFPTPEESEKELSSGINWYGIYPVPVTLVLIFLCYLLVALSWIFSPASALLGLLIRCKDEDIRAVACRCVRLVRKPSKFCLRSLEKCLKDPSGAVNREVIATLSCLGPSEITLNSYVYMLVKSSQASAADVVRQLANRGYEFIRQIDLEVELDNLLRIEYESRCSDSFLSCLLLELTKVDYVMVCKCLNRLADLLGEMKPEQGAFSRSLVLPIARKRRVLCHILCKTLPKLRKIPELSDEVEQLKYELALICINESDKDIFERLSKLSQQL